MLLQLPKDIVIEICTFLVPYSIQKQIAHIRKDNNILAQLFCEWWNNEYAETFKNMQRIMYYSILLDDWNDKFYRISYRFSQKEIEMMRDKIINKTINHNLNRIQIIKYISSLSFKSEKINICNTIKETLITIEYILHNYYN